VNAGCRACGEGWPRPDHRIADLGLSVAYLHDDQFFPGWTVLVLKRHATELFELSRAERAQLIEEVTDAARALAAAFDAVKLNYGLLGNQVPHIHWHLIPRLASDPAPAQAAWGVDHRPRGLSAAELGERIALIRGRLRLAGHPAPSSAAEGG
jgi:diadenosine tetraphosphate (Ap4A) HIT family hydrolase